MQEGSSKVKINGSDYTLKDKVVKKGGKSFETFFSGSPEEGSSKYSFGMWAGIPINPKGNIEIYIMGRKNPDQKPKDLVYPILDEVLSMLKFK